MMLDDLLAAAPGLRRFRGINATMLAALLEREPYECVCCGGGVPKSRRNWCGDDCVKAFRLRCDPASGRDYVIETSRGICAECGADTIPAEREWRAAQRAAGIWPKGFRPGGPTEDHPVFARGVWREVDHVVPVCEGGGLCGPEGLRLLCGRCHHEATRRLAKRMMERRRAARARCEA